MVKELKYIFYKSMLKKISTLTLTCLFSLNLMAAPTHTAEQANQINKAVTQQITQVLNRNDKSFLGEMKLNATQQQQVQKIVEETRVGMAPHLQKINQLKQNLDKNLYNTKELNDKDIADLIKPIIAEKAKIEFLVTKMEHQIYKILSKEQQKFFHEKLLPRLK